MKRLYRTYIQIRNSVRQALKDYFSVLMESHFDVNAFLNTCDSDHILTIINSDSKVTARFFDAIPEYFTTDMPSESQVDADFDLFYAESFNPFITIDSGDVYDINLTTYLADDIKFNITFDEVIVPNINLISSVPDSFAFEIAIDDIYPYSRLYTSTSTIINPDIEFGLIINFDAELVAGSLDEFAFHWYLDDVEFCSALDNHVSDEVIYKIEVEPLYTDIHILDYLSNALSTYINVEDYIITAQLDSKNIYADLFKFDWTFDLDEFISNIVSFTSNMINTELGEEFVYNVYPQLVEYTSAPLLPIVDANIITEDVYNLIPATQNGFVTYIPTTFIVDTNLYVRSYSADLTNYYISLDDFEFYFESLLVDYASDDIQYLIEMSDCFDIKPVFEDAVANMFNYVDVSAFIFNFTAKLYTQDQPADLFRFNVESFSWFDASFDLNTSNIFGLNEEYIFNVDASADSWNADMLTFDWIQNGCFESSLESKIDALIESVIFNSVFEEHNNYPVEVFDVAYSPFVIKDTIVKDEMPMNFVTGSCNEFTFDGVNTLVKDEFPVRIISGWYDNFIYSIEDVLIYNVDAYINNNLINQFAYAFDTYVEAEMSVDNLNIYPKLDFDYEIVLGSAIISDFNTQVAQYEPFDMHGSHINVDFEIDMSAYAETKIHPIDYMPTFIDVDFELYPKGSFIFIDADIIPSYIPLGDVLPKMRVINLTADEFYWSNYIEESIIPTLNVYLENGTLIRYAIQTTLTSDMSSYFIYATYAKLNEYNVSTYTLGSMANSTLNELIYHKYNY